MHGKILRYSATTGSGVIMNASKKIFELRKESWHDNRNRPCVGMYVEFRTGENGHVITDARASKYQEFLPDAVIREIDFWRSKTDEELKIKESEARMQAAQKIYAQTNYLKISSLEVNTSIQICIKEFFARELKSIEFLKEVDTSTLVPVLNYTICKRYLDKALDYLIFTDRKLNMDLFAEYQQRLSTLEYSYLFFTNNTLNTAKVFEEAFLEFQYSFKGAIRAMGGLKDRILQLENKVRVNAQELRVLRSRIDAKKGDEKELQEKISKIRTVTDKAHNEIKILTNGAKNLEDLIKEFSEKNLKIFQAVFNKTIDMLKNKIREAMNVCATQLDNKIWELGMSSISIRNVFFKHDINEPYCMMTFLGQTIKKLDKSKIAAANEKVTYKYYYNHQEKYVKKYLIFTNLPKVEMTVKIQIMAASKNNNVIIAKKDSQFFAAINKEKFEAIYIDPTQLDNETLIQARNDARDSKYNSQSKLFVIPKEQVQNMKE